MQDKYTFKTAQEPDEFQQIFRLNYSTFVEEIPQHERNSSRQLIDKYNNENLYIIAKLGDEVVGMVCIRDQRPFSIDLKVPHIEQHLPAHDKPCEVRLLSIKKEYRHSSVFRGLMTELYRQSIPKGYDLIVISGTERQVKLYENIGFKKFADPVGTSEALYFPMYLLTSDLKIKFYSLP